MSIAMLVRIEARLRTAIYLGAVAIVASLTLLMQPAQAAADYPNQPIKIFCPYAAGGGGDILVRYFAAKLQVLSGQTVIVVNRPGAGGNIGTGAAATSKPDGYTLLMTPNVAFAGNLYLYKDVPYHPVKSFAPITTLARLPFVFAIPPQSPINSVSQLIDTIRSKDGRATYAGTTTTAIMGVEYLLKMTDTRATRVPYKALVDTIPDIAAGTLDLVLGDMTFLLGHAKAGRTKLLAVTTTERSGAVPELPTMREAGFPEYDIPAWWAAYAPADTPKEIVGKLEVWLNEIVATDETRAFLLTVATDPMPGSSERLAALLGEEIEKWRRLMEIARLEPQ